jgi:hypothetical protein
MGQQIVQALDRAQPTADLQTHGSLRGEGEHDRPIGEHALARPVEIDHVHPACPEGAVAREQLVRPELVACLGREVALVEPHAAAVPEIDCRNEQHHSSLRKL